MALSCGIIGLPNVGKSTLFNALTKANIEASNFPFCTIEPNTGIVFVPDNRLQPIADLVKTERVIPSSVEFVDIAGLVKGASKGEGLGNAFLANIREVQAIVHVVRCFADENITHVHNKIDPAGDADTVNTELILADLEALQKQYSKRHRLAQSGDAQAKKEIETLGKVIEVLNDGKPARVVELHGDEKKLIDGCFLLTSKPVLYVANVDETSARKGNEYSNILADYAKQQQAGMLVLCNSIEAEIAQLDKETQSEFLADLSLDEPGLHKLIRSGYKLLGLQTFFTAGKKETRAWTFPAGASAPDAAGVIHTDFKKGFIRAEVVGYNDYIEYGGEAGAKEAGKWRLEGKDYLVTDGDVMHFRFNA